MSDVETQKFQVTKTPPLPGECVSCKKSADGVTSFIDWGLSLDYFGAVVFCYNCGFELAVAIGMAPVAERNALEVSLLEADAEKERLINERDSALNVIRAIGDLRLLLGDETPGNQDSESDDRRSSGGEQKGLGTESLFT